MSTLFVKVCTYTVSDHPNADALVLASPSGTTWQCCIRKHFPFEGELAVYVPIDSILPAGMAEKIGLPNSKEDKPYRVRTIKLRGALSQGLLLPLSTLVDAGFLPEFTSGLVTEVSEDSLLSDEFICERYYKIGDDVASLLNITKWEPPLPESADLIPNPSGFKNYTSPEHFKNFPEVLQDGEEVILTEKIHGTSWRAGWVEVAHAEGPVFQFFVGTKRNTVFPGADNKYTRVAVEYNVERRLQDYPGYIAYGELYGKGIQSLQYGRTGHALRIFDVWNGQCFLNWEQLKSFSIETGLPLVPTLFEGSWDAAVLSHRFGPAFEGDHIREGFVVKPIIERWDYKHALGRVILKVVSEDYLLKNYDVDEIG